MIRILITGASGLLGLNVAVEAVKDFDIFGVAHNHPLHTPDFAMLSADLIEPAAVKQIYDWAQPDWVIHCAALTDLETCEASPTLAEELNANLPGRMAAEAFQCGARFVHISTDAVFDGEKGDYAEADAPNPLSVYARTKLAGEQSVAAAYPESIIARLNMFGWSLSGKRSLAEFFFNNLRDGNPVKGFTDIYFCPLLVNDLAHILFNILDSDLSGLYHVFSADAISKYDFGVAIAHRFGFDESLIEPVSLTDGGLQAARSPNLTMRTGKLAQALGNPLPTIAAGLDRFFALYRQEYPKKLYAFKEPVR